MKLKSCVDNLYQIASCHVHFAFHMHLKLIAILWMRLYRYTSCVARGGVRCKRSQGIAFICIDVWYWLLSCIGRYCVAMLLGDGLDYSMACGLMKVLWFCIVSICIHGRCYNNVYGCGYKFGKKTMSHGYESNWCVDLYEKNTLIFICTMIYHTILQYAKLDT